MVGPDILVIAAFAYLAGSIPFGLLVTRLGGKGDIRAIGSGNIGATNVLRTGSKGLAFATLLLDGGKGAAVVLATASLGGDGKGVATCVATFAAFDIRLGIVFVILWLGTATATRYSSLAALVATMGCSVASVWLQLPMPVAGAVIIMSGISWTRHHENIGRLLTGQESRIGKK